MPPRNRRTPPVSASFAPADLPALVTPDTPPPAAVAEAQPAPKPVRARTRKAPATALEPDPAPAAEAEPEPAPRAEMRYRTRKQRSVYLDEELWQRARGFVAWVQYESIAGEADTMADLVSEGLELVMARKEKKYLDGTKTFRAPTGTLRRGPGTQGHARLTNEG